MRAAILATKLYAPPPRPRAVPRPRLIEQLNAGLSMGHKLTLISAPAGFGKTTLVSEWVAGLAPGLSPSGRREGVRVAWLSLDTGDSDPARFLAYLVAALQTIFAGIGAGVMAALESSQPPATEALLTVLLNEIAALRQEFILVLDDYHLVDAQPVDQALAFLIEHQPPQMRLVIATREDPQLPLARLRARGQLAELRAADLRFTPAEAAEFLNQVMGLNLSTEDIAALDTRTEGWIAGLQLAALSMQGQRDTAGFIRSFTGSHHFVLDYLVEEVLGQQPADVQVFLLRTSILDRLCGPLCDAVMGIGESTNHAARSTPLTHSHAILEDLDRANLFIVPLDNERRWYRYHHLLAELLRQRLGQSLAPEEIAELHLRASEWYENNDLLLEAFQHAADANDMERAERLITGRKMPFHSLAAVTAILDWLESRPQTVMEARPWLWVRSATSLLMAGQITGVEEKLQAAEKVLQNAAVDDRTCDVMGQIAAIRATLALIRYQPEQAIPQARRALGYLHSDNLPFRCRAVWTLGFAHQLQGDRAAARQAYTEAIAIGQSFGNVYYTVLATTSLGQIQEADNQLYQAAETYQRSLHLLSDQGPPNASEECVGLARVHYQWNDLDTAERYAQQSFEQALQYDRAIDRYIICEVLLARLKLTRGEIAGAAAMLAEIEQAVRQNNFVQRMPEVAAVQVRLLLRQGHLAAAAQLAGQNDLPLTQARVLIARNDPSAALSILTPYRQQVEAKGWADERLRALTLEALALYALRAKDKALQLLGEALALAEPGGFIRVFVDEGEPMRMLIADFRSWIDKPLRGHDPSLPGYVDKLLAAFGQPPPIADLGQSQIRNPQLVLNRAEASAILEPLSQRELEVLKLIAQGLSNREIGARLFLALDTVKGHNRRIFDKLLVQSRSEAIARARELGLL